jgi:hypothetical protein
VLGPLERLDKIIDDVKPDRLIVALTERRGRMPMAQLLECGAKGILVEDGLRVYEYFTGKLPIESLTPSFLIFSGAFRKSRLQLALRRTCSLLAAVTGLLLTACSSSGRCTRSCPGKRSPPRSGIATTAPASPGWAV